jgi:hypothetical protein
MRRGHTWVVVSVLGALAVACCANRHGNGEPYGKGRNEVLVTVTADFKVAPDPVHLSIAKGQQCVWTLDAGSGPLGVEPKEQWPLKVSCDSPRRCVGRITRGAKPGSFPYRVVIAGKPGPDPMIIIDP